jgi:integrase
MAERPKDIVEQFVEWRMGNEGSMTLPELQAEIQQLRARLAIPEKRQARPRAKGTGSIYKRGKGSRFYWAQWYSPDGTVNRESTKTESPELARKFLQKKVTESATGHDHEQERVSISELVKQLIQKKKNEEIKGAKSVSADEGRWRVHLEPAFGKLKVRQLTAGALSSYVCKRKEDGAENGTINREFALLKRAFSVADVRPVAKFPMLPESQPRQGFADDETLTALYDQASRVGLWLRAIVEVGATFGFRRGELINLRCSAVDVGRGTIRLEASETKNGRARVVALTPSTKVLLAACVTGKQPGDCVFTKDGSNVSNDLRREWRHITKAVGQPELLFHSLRRTAVGNLIRAGVSEKVAQSISGHRTRSVFDRYHIVSETDIAAAASKLTTYQTSQAQSRCPKMDSTTVTDTVTEEKVN